MKFETYTTLAGETPFRAALVSVKDIANCLRTSSGVAIRDGDQYVNVRCSPNDMLCAGDLLLECHDAPNCFIISRGDFITVSERLAIDAETNVNSLDDDHPSGIGATIV